MEEIFDLNKIIDELIDEIQRMKNISDSITLLEQTTKNLVDSFERNASKGIEMFTEKVDEQIQLLGEPINKLDTFGKESVNIMEQATEKILIQLKIMTDSIEGYKTKLTSDVDNLRNKIDELDQSISSIATNYGQIEEVVTKLNDSLKVMKSTWTETIDAVSTSVQNTNAKTLESLEKINQSTNKTLNNISSSMDQKIHSLQEALLSYENSLETKIVKTTDEMKSLGATLKSGTSDIEKTLSQRMSDIENAIHLQTSNISGKITSSIDKLTEIEEEDISTIKKIADRQLVNMEQYTESINNEIDKLYDSNKLLQDQLSKSNRKINSMNLLIAINLVITLVLVLYVIFV